MYLPQLLCTLGNYSCALNFFVTISDSARYIYIDHLVHGEELALYATYINLYLFHIQHISLLQEPNYHSMHNYHVRICLANLFSTDCELGDEV